MFSDALAAVASSVYKIGMGLLASVEASARELEAKTAELDVASLVFFVLSHKSFPCVITSNSRRALLTILITRYGLKTGLGLMQIRNWSKKRLFSATNTTFAIPERENP